MSKAIHYRDDPFGSKEAHQLILKGDKKDRFSRVALPSGTSTELAVDAARLMALGAQNKEATQLTDTGTELDVGATSCHVGGNGDCAFLARFGNNFGFTVVLTGVEHVVNNFFCAKHS